MSSLGKQRRNFVGQSSRIIHKLASWLVSNSMTVRWQRAWLSSSNDCSMSAVSNNIMACSLQLLIVGTEHWRCNTYDVACQTTSFIAVLATWKHVVLTVVSHCRHSQTLLDYLDAGSTQWMSPVAGKRINRIGISSSGCLPDVQGHPDIWLWH